MKNSSLIDKQIYNHVSKYLNKEGAKRVCEDIIRLGLEKKDISEELNKKHGEAVIFLEGINELEKVYSEIYNSKWYNSYFNEDGNIK